MTARAQQHLLHAPFDAAAVEERPPYVHDALWTRWVAFRAAKGRPVFTAEERGLFDLLQGYADVMDCTRGWQRATARREIFVLHLLNHWFKARSVVLAHDRIIDAYRQQRRARRATAAPGAKEKRGGGKGRKQAAADGAAEAAAQSLAGEEDIFDSENYELRDRGFGKTRLFVMLPMRNIALQYVKTIVEVLGADPLACPKLETFVADFSEMEEAVDPTFVRRPPDYQRQFDGNIDDSFRVGLHLEPSRVHLYAHPLNSDIILCSPLGLRRRIERSGDVLVSLSSIEVCLMDEAHVLLMQNWDHAGGRVRAAEQRPRTTHGLSDLRRVYAWALQGKSGRHRQTILCSDISHATLLGALRGSLNSSGKVLLQRREEEGAVAKVTGAVRQHFLRFDTTALDRADDDRFDYFTKQVFATKLNTLAERNVRIILFVPSYFDFVRLRNYLYREYRDTFAALSEYSTLKQQRRALGQFSDLERPVLLVTERFYFFKRYFVKLAEVMVFYSPPLFPEFYSGLINRLVASSPNAFALTLYCRYDTHELHRLVGTSRTRQLLERESSMFSFVTA
ncbi:U3 small nucleolar RNA-associated protein 25 [Strigomonas culicis]|uniref:U3 small nucleolar RNA-associated protein 25 n=1 Tax=Strigomonas culicis TaxID=28005 RepID=S9TN72_9TRYP|nr:U3 small nucleolar RNA-associated protein 25 [Strigomonas culicis]|eukprot:EPY19722.1 U3 small nucleolar RNA-associated protein 25 [Strigomonas culicis]